MPTKPRTARDILFTHIAHRFELAGYWFGDRWCPAVVERNGGYQIRILAGEKASGNHSVTTTYEYFELDGDGLILRSPRGFAAEYNRRVRVTDIAEAVTRHAKLGTEG